MSRHLARAMGNWRRVCQEIGHLGQHFLGILLQGDQVMRASLLGNFCPSAPNKGYLLLGSYRP